MTCAVSPNVESANAKVQFPKRTWYAIAASTDIKRKPVGMRRLGQALVLWRDERGELIAQSRHCPHRGVDLSLGRVSGGRLECPYHGFQFASDGQCVAMPCEGRNRAVPQSMRVRRYITQEAHGLVWLWWGDAVHQPADLPWFESLQDRPKRWADGEMFIDIPFTRAAESALVDIHHVAFAHKGVAGLMGMGQAKQLNLTKVEVAGREIVTEGVLHSAETSPIKGSQLEESKSSKRFKQSFSFSHRLLFPNLALFDFKIGGLVLFVSLTPIDEDHSWAYFRYYATSGWPWLGRAIARLSVWFELKFVQPDDYRLIKSTVPQHSGLRANRFVSADKTIVQWHRLYQYE